jgi:hypothetical protein
MGRRLRARGRKLAAGAVAAVAIIILCWQARSGVSVSRIWAGEGYRSTAAAVEDRVSCLARAIDSAVPEGAPVHVPLGEVFDDAAGGLLFFNIVEHVYRRAPLVERPDQARFILGLSQTPGSGCGGYTLTVQPAHG